MKLLLLEDQAADRDVLLAMMDGRPDGVEAARALRARVPITLRCKQEIKGEYLDYRFEKIRRNGHE